MPGNTSLPLEYKPGQVIVILRNSVSALDRLPELEVLQLIKGPAWRGLQKQLGALDQCRFPGLSLGDPIQWIWSRGWEFPRTSPVGETGTHLQRLCTWGTGGAEPAPALKGLVTLAREARREVRIPVRGGMKGEL